MISNHLKYGTGDADTVSKNQSNNPLFMGIGMDKVNKALKWQVL